ncbi:ricin-type beta-trefoil lectin domain protein [Streptomyces hokutonensis]|uniref:ricin-type beta-trefoil lectin domain protein n=1 Tax=Streptomyces hokutonensis TaxID=1306990 RepID=UPI00369C7326
MRLRLGRPPIPPGRQGRPRPPKSRRFAVGPVLTRFLPPVLATALLAGVAVGSGQVLPADGRDAVPASDSYPWYEDTAAEQLRQDQCLMTDVLRLGGTSMAATAQNALNQPQDVLHTQADRAHWQQTPLSTAYEKDRAFSTRELNEINALRDAWKTPVTGLTTPAGFTETGFHWPPGTNGDGQESFYGQTGLTKWISDRFWQNEDGFYEDSTPAVDATALAAVDTLGNPRYTADPDPSLPTGEWNRARAERDAFSWMHGGPGRHTDADDARIFLESGGFPRTAPEPDSAEYRIAVENLKSRFATCAWRDPLDPNGVLDAASSAAAAEWQQEIASQATQRNQILDANKTAVEALAAASKSLGDLLGQSWAADRLTRWQDYWSDGGVGWVGNAPTAIKVHGAAGKCLEVQDAAKTDGAAVQLNTCSTAAAQKWEIFGDDKGLHLRNVNSLKCVDVAGNNPANGTKIRQFTCNSSPAQTWEFNLRATSALKNTGTGKCVDLAAYTVGQDSRLWDCTSGGPQQYDVTPSGHTGTVPPAAQFTKATAGIAKARAVAANKLADIKAQLTAAQKAATASDTAEQAAYTVADTSGAPRGRGLLVGQQKAQVTKGAVAALDAMVKAGTTAEAATRAAVADSATITQRALAQAAQVKAEFRKKAAEKAELQAKAAADAAKIHRDNAKKDKETAEAKLTVALGAESDAKAAAADAHAKRLAAESEEATAKAEKETAEAKQAEANQHKQTAQAEATKAKDAQGKAETAEKTAQSRRDDAVAARDNAKDKRDDAWEAEQKADAARAKADAKGAYADSLDSGDAADAARSAANEADTQAGKAETAATNARAAANAATQAAAEADAAATRAEAAAKRARADADAAQAAKLKADAAVRTATAAVADAVKAAAHAAEEAKTAVQLADQAEELAKTAKTNANAALKEAANAVLAAARAAGFAHVTAQAAVDATTSAEQVAAPANDAIQLGSPYLTTDSAAALVVLSGQSSKTIAEQQQAVAAAHARNASEEAVAAQAIADQATGDAKAALQHAANAAGYAKTARGYAQEALGYAADAAAAAAKAAQSLTRTIEYDRQATEDAAAADAAAGRAENYATSARSAADQAALDATAARAAATEAEQAAKDARAAADRADVAATEAEQAAKDADKYATEAQEAADAAERKKANEQVGSGAGTGVGGTFYVVDEDTVEITDAKQHEPCEIKPGFEGCTVTFTVTFKATVDFYLCTNPDVPATAAGCPSEDTLPLDRKTFTGLKKDVTRSFSKLEIIQQTVVYQILKAVLVQDFLDCWHGSASGCAWAASNFIPGKAFEKAAELVRALDAALNTGVGVRDAFNALKALDLDPATLHRIEDTVNLYEDMITSCRINSFPGTTQVLMADGSRRAISEVRRGDLVLATDPETGKDRAQQVTATYAHGTDRLMKITLSGGSSLTSTDGHRLYVTGRGWVHMSELRTGDRLRAPDDTLHAVTGLRSLTGLASSRVYDLTVEGTHTFYVRTEGTRAADVLVHNCVNLSDETAFPATEAHTLRKHVNVTPQEAIGLAKKNLLEGKAPFNAVWTNADIAQQAVDRVVGQYFFPNGKKRTASFDALDNFLNKRGQWRNKKEFVITGRWDKYPSLGKIYGADESVTIAGNEVRVVLHRLPGKSGHEGYIVYTSYPLPK